MSAIPPSLTDHRCPAGTDGVSFTAMTVSMSAGHLRSVREGEWHSLLTLYPLRTRVHFCFTVADVQKPILGADFLRHFGLLVDIKQHQLTDTTTQLHIQGIISFKNSPSPSSVLMTVEARISNYYLNIHFSPKFTHQTLPSSMTSHTILRRWDLPCQPAHDIWLQSVCK